MTIVQHILLICAMELSPLNSGFCTLKHTKTRRIQYFVNSNKEYYGIIDFGYDVFFDMKYCIILFVYIVRVK